jgi:hypothetical protein
LQANEKVPDVPAHLKERLGVWVTGAELDLAMDDHAFADETRRPLHHAAILKLFQYASSNNFKVFRLDESQQRVFPRTRVQEGCFSMISSQYHVVENSRCEQSRPSSHPSRRAELDRTCKIRKTRKSDPKLLITLLQVLDYEVDLLVRKKSA